jgi:hypothetical protein
MRIVLLAVGLGNFFIIGCDRCKKTWSIVSVRNADSPDMFLIDVQRDQVKAVKKRSVPDGVTPAACAGPTRPRRQVAAGVISRTTRTCVAADRSPANTRSRIDRSWRERANRRRKVDQPSDEPEVSVEQSISETSRSTSGTRSLRWLWPDNAAR